MYNKIQFKIIALILLITAIFVFGLISLRNAENRNYSSFIKGRIAEKDTVIRKIISLKSETLITYVFDYSYWDEMVTFSRTKEEKWAEENIVPSIKTFGLDAVWILDNDFNTSYSLNSANDRAFTLPITKEDFKSIVNKNLFSHFFVYTTRGLMEISIAPLQPGADLQRVTIPLGYYIGGRLWTKEYLDNISELTYSRMEILKNPKDSIINEDLSSFEFVNVIELKDWNGSTLSRLNAVTTSYSTKEFLKLENYQFIATIFFIVLVILLISLYLFKLLNKPLKAITLSLEKESSKPLEELTSRKNEFGEIARLINEFFENKNSLLAEIMMRTNAENLLIKNQAELIKAKEKAEELSKLKSNLLANLSHEFRTPLSGIIGLSELLKLDSHDEEQKRLLNDISVSGKRLHDTLNSILLLAQFESSDITVHKEKFNLGTEIRSQFENIKYKAEDKNLELKIILEEEDIYLDTDRDLIKQILFNLYDNAVKFTVKGSIKIKLSSRIINGMLNAEVNISDTGIGIQKKDIDFIFDEFRQGSEGFKRKYEGTGLGLTLTKKILGILGGKIECRSEPGIGTTFTVFIPAFKIINMEEEMEKDISGQKVKPLNVLFVEDNPSNQYVFKKFIEDVVNVDFASTGENALEFVKIKHYDLIFMDINLGPGMDGIETLKKIRETEGKENLIVAALTGYAMENDREHFLSCGFDYFIVKPFGKNDLLNVINDIKNKKTN
ncbi:MAG: response regulator [Ignavibacteriae bacterium]|nr:response regulator [Ignavibacteriota bacterium]